MSGRACVDTAVSASCRLRPRAQAVPPKMRPGSALGGSPQQPSQSSSWPTMRDFVRTLVAGELGRDLPTEEAQAAFRKVFQRVSVAPGRRTAGRGDEAIVGDLIAAHLLQKRQQDSRGLDHHLRFHGLSRRMVEHPLLRRPELRCSVLQVLFALRGDGAAALGVTADGRSRQGLGLNTLKGHDLAAELRETFGQVLAVAPVTTSSSMRAHTRAGGAAENRVGWHMPPGNAPPVGVSEQQLLRDLLHALQGVDSGCFRYQKVQGQFEVHPSYVLSRPAWCLTQKILELAALHMRLCMATNAVLDSDTGISLLRQAMCEAIREQVRDYYKVLALLMAKVQVSRDADKAPHGSVPQLTLRRLWAWMQESLGRMRLLVALSEACAPLRGGALASAVYGFSRVGDAVAQAACTTILRRVVEPLLAMIRAWMTEGELQDPFGEFFVCADASVPLEDLWTRSYWLDIEMVPSFMSLELARKILLTGRSVNFVRLCCSGQDWLPSRVSKTQGGGLPGGADGSRSGDRLLAMPGDPRSAADVLPELNVHGAEQLPLAQLSARVAKAATETNKHVVSLMMKQYALGEHCMALRRFLLLGQGDFVESLMDAAQAELGREAREVYRHQLTGLVDMAVRQSNAQFCHADTLARLGVKVLSASSGERGWDVFLLDYAIDSPLHVVLTPTAMQKYDRTFAFLWKLRRVSHSLAACWRQHMALQRHLISCGQRFPTRAPELGLEMRQTLHKCTCLRNEMHHFVQNIQSYVMCEVLESSWARLQTGWQACTDLDQVITEHQRYLACIEEGAFLTSKTDAILTGLTSLFTLALEFTEIHDQVCASTFEAVEVLKSEPSGPSPFARSLAECRAQLDQIGVKFQVQLQALLRALEAQPMLRQTSADLRFLVCRLDFNGYYEGKRAAPFSERIRLG